MNHKKIGFTLSILIVTFSGIYFILSQSTAKNLPLHRCNNYLTAKSAPNLNLMAAWEVKNPPRLFVKSLYELKAEYSYRPEKELQLELMLREDKSIECFRLLQRNYNKNGDTSISQPEYTEIKKYSPEIKEMMQRLKDWKYNPTANVRKINSDHINVYVWQDLKREKLVQLPNGSRDSFEITMSRNHGEDGTMFNVHIKNDGSVVYNGIVHVKTIGRHEFKLSKMQIDNLYNFIIRNNIWGIDSFEYNVPSDTSTVGLSLEFGAEERKYFHQDYHEFGAPYDIFALEQYIEEISQIIELTGR